MTKFKQFVGWIAMILAILGLTVFMSASRAAADTSAPADPTGETAPSELGKYWQLKLLNLSDVTQNGFITQPSNQNVVATSGDSMPISVETQVTNDNGGLIGWLFPKQQVNAMSYRRYDSGWNPNFSKANSYSVGNKQPITSLRSTISVPPVPGTYYYQLKIQFSDGTPTTAYSESFVVTVVPKPVKAVGVSPTANPQEVLWGQPSRIQANLNPSGSTAIVSWQPKAPDGQSASLSNSTEHSTLLYTPNHLKKIRLIVPHFGLTTAHQCQLRPLPLMTISQRLLARPRSH